MNDTSPEIERIVHERMMALSPQERFIMGSRMFDAARELILSTFPPDLPPAEVRQRLFERLYGDEIKVTWTWPDTPYPREFRS